MDIGDWLSNLGLEQYEVAFRQNAIDEKVLPKLTPEDLRDLGVTIVGHRRVLLDAIADLRSGTNAVRPALAAIEPVTAPAKVSAAERRQVR